MLLSPEIVKRKDSRRQTKRNKQQFTRECRVVNTYVVDIVDLDFLLVENGEWLNRISHTLHVINSLLTEREDNRESCWEKGRRVRKTSYGLSEMSRERERERTNEWINYFTRVVEKTRGLFTSSPRPWGKLILTKDTMSYSMLSTGAFI